MFPLPCFSAHWVDGSCWIGWEWDAVVGIVGHGWVREETFNHLLACAFLKLELSHCDC